MAAAVKIPITAIDRASMTLDKVNGKIASLQAPVRNAGRSLSRFFSLTGVSSMRKGMGDLSRTTLDTFRSVGRLVPEMGALTSAASVAGVYRLASAWAHVGTNMRTSSRSIGMDVGRHMALRNAAELSGGSADAMSGALSQLSQQKWEAVNGFAPEMAAQFQALGISMDELKKSSPEQLFDRIANKIRAIRDPAAKTIAAVKLFGQAGEGLLPVFQQSSRAFDDNIRLAQRYGVMNDKGADAASRMQNAQRQLSLAVEGFGYSVAEAVEPAITPVLQQMAEWIAANRAWIAQDIAGYVRQLAAWLRNGGWEKIKADILGIGTGISTVVDKLGGWKSAAIALVAGMSALWAAPAIAGLAALVGMIGSVSAGFIAATAAAGALIAIFRTERGRNFLDGMPGIAMLENAASDLTGGAFGRSYEQQHAAQAEQNLGGADTVEQGRQIQRFFMRNGYTAEQSAGLVANLAQEDGNFDPSKVGDNGTAYGIGQWHHDRQEDFRRVIGRDIHGSSRDDQLRFMKWELDNRSYLGGADIKRAQTASQAAALASVDYFRPGLTQADQLHEMSNRAGLGTDWSRRLAQQPDAPDPDTAYDKMIAELNVTRPSAPAAIMPAAPSTQADAAPERMQLDVHVRTQGAPGTSVKTGSTSPNLKVASVTQHRAMDPANTAIGN